MRMIYITLIFLLGVLAGCGDLPQKEFDTETATSSGTGRDTTSATGSGADTSTAVDTGSGTDAVTDTGTAVDTGSDSDTATTVDTASATDTTSSLDTGTVTDTGLDTTPDTGTDTGTVTDTGTATDTGTDPDTATDTGSGSDTGSDTGTDSGTGTGTDSETGTGSDSSNAAPTLTHTGTTTVVEGSEMSITISAVDPESDNVTLSEISIPMGGSFDSASGVFTWTPGNDVVAGLFQSDEIILQFEGVDAGTPAATGTLDVTVTVLNDEDEDSFADNDDNCPSYENGLQVDYDSDGIGVACDPLIQIDESLSLWQSGTGARYAYLDANQDAMAVNFYVFDEDAECSVEGNCSESSAIIIEPGEVVTEVMGTYPGAGDDEEAVFVDANGIAWLDLGQEAWRVENGAVTTHYAPTAPNTNAYNYFYDLSDGATLVYHEEYYWIDIESYDQSDSVYAYYYWDGATETPILEDVATRHLLTRGDAKYLLTEDSMGMPSFTVFTTSGYSNVSLSADSARIMSLGMPDNAMMLCTYNDSTGIATLHLYTDGAETGSVPFTADTSCSDIDFPQVYDTDRQAADFPDADGYYWFSSMVAPDDWNVYRWHPGTDDLQLVLGNHVDNIERLYMAGSNYYAMAITNSELFWLNGSNVLQSISTDFSTSVDYDLNVAGIITWTNRTPSSGYGSVSDPIEISVHSADGATVQSNPIPLTPVANHNAGCNQLHFAPSGIAWFTINDIDSSGNGNLTLYAYDHNSDTLTEARTRVSGSSYENLRILSDEGGNTLLGMSDRIYRITGATTLVELASTHSTFYVMETPEISDDGGYSWLYYQTSPSVFAVASFGSGTFTERLSGLTSYPSMYRDHTGFAFLRYQNAGGYTLARASGGAVTSLLSGLSSIPSISRKEAATYIAYSDGSNNWGRTLENGVISDPAVWSDASVATGYDGGFLVHFAPQSGDPDNLYTYCQYPDGDLSNAISCVDAKVASFQQEYSIRNYNGLTAGILENTATNSVYIYRHIPQPVPDDCCAPQSGGGCTSPGIMACVCAENTACCSTEWTTDCVGLIASRGCGECTL